jgi:PhnB protein
METQVLSPNGVTKPQMQLTTSLFFNGNAEEVLEYYRSALGGEVEIRQFAGTPAAEFVPPEWAGKVIYGMLRSPLGNVAAMDTPPDRAVEPGGSFGISIETQNEAQAEDVFSKLSAGGEATMPLEKTFWAKKFGMCTDKFGITWMVNYGLGE